MRSLKISVVLWLIQWFSDAGLFHLPGRSFFIMLVICHLMATRWLPKFRHRSLILPFVLSRKKEDTGQNYFCGRCLFLLLWLFCLFHVAFCLFRKQNLSWKLPSPQIFLLMPHFPELDHMLTHISFNGKGK